MLRPCMTGIPGGTFGAIASPPAGRPFEDLKQAVNRCRYDEEQHGGANERPTGERSKSGQHVAKCDVSDIRIPADPASSRPGTSRLSCPNGRWLTSAGAMVSRDKGRSLVIDAAVMFKSDATRALLSKESAPIYVQQHQDQADRQPDASLTDV
jgi:hypothetical protein